MASLYMGLEQYIRFSAIGAPLDVYQVQTMIVAFVRGNRDSNKDVLATK